MHLGSSHGDSRRRHCTSRCLSLHWAIAQQTRLPTLTSWPHVRSGTPARRRGSSEPHELTAGATIAYIVGRKALEKENQDLAAHAIAAGLKGHHERKGLRKRSYSAHSLQGAVRGKTTRDKVRMLKEGIWTRDEEVLLAVLQWMAEKEDIFKVLLHQVECQADFLFPERKRRYAGSLQATVLACVDKGLVVMGGREPKEWVSLAPHVAITALPVAPITEASQTPGVLPAATTVAVAKVTPASTPRSTNPFDDLLPVTPEGTILTVNTTPTPSIEAAARHRAATFPSTSTPSRSTNPFDWDDDDIDTRPARSASNCVSPGPGVSKQLE